MAQIVTIGELLVDMLSFGTSDGLTGQAYRPIAGGAPANVAVGAKRLGVSAAFLGKVGDDLFGRSLAATLIAEGVEVDGLHFDDSARTALAFVTVDGTGERDFTFYRQPSADMLLRKEEIDSEALERARIVHFGSISLISEPSRSATLHAIDVAKAAGARISYDPNLRLPLWPDAGAARQGMLLGLQRASLVKLSVDELAFLTGSSDHAAARSLMGEACEAMLITRGESGCDYVTTEWAGTVPGYETTVIDTNGAGDAFMAGFLTRLAAHTDLMTSEEEMRRGLTWANAVAALVVGRSGALPAMPHRGEVETFLFKRTAAAKS